MPLGELHQYEALEDVTMLEIFHPKLTPEMKQILQKQAKAMGGDGQL